MNNQTLIGANPIRGRKNILFEFYAGSRWLWDKLTCFESVGPIDVKKLHEMGWGYTLCSNI